MASLLSLGVTLLLWLVAALSIRAALVKYKGVPRVLMFIFGYACIFIGGFALFHFLFIV